MGGGVVGLDWRHVITSILGYSLASWNQSDKTVINAIQEAGRVAEERCFERVRDNLGCVSSTSNQFSLEFKLGVGFTLISVTGGLVGLIWYWCCKRRVSCVVPAGRDSDSSPDSLDNRRRLAHQQLAEIRSRGRRDGTSQ